MLLILSNRTTTHYYVLKLSTNQCTSSVNKKNIRIFPEPIALVFIQFVREHSHMTSPLFWRFLTPLPCHQFYSIRIKSNVIISLTPFPLKWWHHMWMVPYAKFFTILEGFIHWYNNWFPGCGPATGLHWC